MSATSPAIQKLARRLIDSEPARAEAFNGDLDQAARVVEKLRLPLAKLVGLIGFSSLLSRALALAKRQASSLDGMHVKADGLLSGGDGVQSRSSTSDAAPHGKEFHGKEIHGKEFHGKEIHGKEIHGGEIHGGEIHRGEILVAELLCLLVTFIGQPLTLNLVRQVWPDASPDSSIHSNEEKP